jgi:hypothetical protein
VFLGNFTSDSYVSDVENGLQATWNVIINGGVAKDPATRLWTLHGDVQWVGEILELYNRQYYGRNSKQKKSTYQRHTWYWKVSFSDGFAGVDR